MPLDGLMSAITTMAEVLWNSWTIGCCMSSCCLARFSYPIEPCPVGLDSRIRSEALWNIAAPVGMALATVHVSDHHILISVLDHPVIEDGT